MKYKKGSLPGIWEGAFLILTMHQLREALPAGAPDSLQAGRDGQALLIIDRQDLADCGGLASGEVLVAPVRGSGFAIPRPEAVRESDSDLGVIPRVPALQPFPERPESSFMRFAIRGAAAMQALPRSRFGGPMRGGSVDDHDIAGHRPEGEPAALLHPGGVPDPRSEFGSMGCDHSRNHGNPLLVNVRVPGGRKRDGQERVGPATDLLVMPDFFRDALGKRLGRGADRNRPLPSDPLRFRLTVILRHAFGTPCPLDVRDSLGKRNAPIIRPLAARPAGAEEAVFQIPIASMLGDKHLDEIGRLLNGDVMASAFYRFDDLDKSPIRGHRKEALDFLKQPPPDGSYQTLSVGSKRIARLP